MAQKSSLDTNELVLPVLASMAAGGGKSDGGNGSNDALQAVLQALAKRLAVEESKDEDAKEQLLSQKRASAKNIAGERANREYRQKMCTHFKDNGKSAIGGQRLSSGRGFFLCQHCYKEFWIGARPGTDEVELPPHLYISGDLVGSAA